MAENKLKISDIIGAVVIPIVLVILIFVLAVYVNVGGQYHLLGQDVIGVILTNGFAQMIVMGVPLVLGLLWNKWAGGAAGFIMGGIYYVASAGHYNGLYAAGGMVAGQIQISPDILAGIGNGTITSLNVAGYSTVPFDFFGDISMLFYLVNAVIIGYMAGSLNNGSMNFKRMLGAGLTAATITAVIQAYMNYNVSLGDPTNTGTARGMAVAQWTNDPLMAIVTGFVPSIALGVIVPILAKVMTWYGIYPQRH